MSYTFNMLVDGSIKDILKSSYRLLIFFVVLTITVFFNSLGNKFVVMDDLNTVITNEAIRSIPEAIRTLKFTNILYSLLFKIDGLNPLYWHIASLIVHILNVVLGFILSYKLFGKKIAIFATIALAIHPVNAEAINWVSGRNYLHFTFIIFLTTLLYLRFVETQKKIFYYASLEFFAICALFNRHPYLMILPLFIIAIEFFFINNNNSLFVYKKLTNHSKKPKKSYKKKNSLQNSSPKFEINTKRLQKILLYLIPIVFFILPFITENLATRFANQLNPETGIIKKRYNQENLTPVIQGYPFTVYSMTNLYLFPKDLTVYYNGEPITSTDYALMYIYFFVYLGAIIYFYKKSRKVSAILTVILITLAPTFSPIKITWFIAERYLYIGSLFFGALVGITTYKLSDILWNKYGFKHLPLVTLIIISTLYSIRTFYRNKDWSDQVTLSHATMATAPKSARPHNELGLYYLRNNEFQKGFDSYQRGLEINKEAGIGPENMGKIYLLKGPNAFKYRGNHKLPFSDEEIKIKADFYYSLNNNPVAIFLYVDYLKTHPEDTETINQIANIYKRLGRDDYAEQTYKISQNSY